MEEQPISTRISDIGLNDELENNSCIKKYSALRSPVAALICSMGT